MTRRERGLPGKRPAPPVEGWADARIGYSLEINISLTIAKS